MLYEDNKACIKWVENPYAHSRTKHIDVRYYFEREQQFKFEVYGKRSSGRHLSSRVPELGWLVVVNPAELIRLFVHDRIVSAAAEVQIHEVVRAYLN